MCIEHATLTYNTWAHWAVESKLPGTGEAGKCLWALPVFASEAELLKIMWTKELSRTGSLLTKAYEGESEQARRHHVLVAEVLIPGPLTNCK